MSTTSRSRPRGFTLVEMVITVAIIAILTTLAFFGMQRMKPRAGLASTSAQLTALLNAARQNSLATGTDTVVMFFTKFANGEGGTGRVILYEDAAFNFFNTTGITPNFAAYDPAAPLAPTNSSDVFETLDLPRGMSFGFGGTTAPTSMPAPYATIVPSLCSFCSAAGNGAVVFDSRGRARFFNANGAPLQVVGGTIALQSSDVSGYRLIVITASTGSIKFFSRG